MVGKVGVREPGCLCSVPVLYVVGGCTSLSSLGTWTNILCIKSKLIVDVRWSEGPDNTRGSCRLLSFIRKTLPAM